MDPQETYKENPKWERSGLLGVVGYLRSLSMESVTDNCRPCGILTGVKGLRIRSPGIGHATLFYRGDQIQYVSAVTTFNGQLHLSVFVPFGAEILLVIFFSSLFCKIFLGFLFGFAVSCLESDTWC